MKCIHCKSELNEGATVCASCRREQPSALKGCLGFFIVFAVIIGISFAICGQDTPTENGVTGLSSNDDPAIILEEMSSVAIGTLVPEGAVATRRYVAAYIKNSDIAPADENALFNCVSDHIFHKDAQLELSKVTDWCSMDLSANADLFRTSKGYVNFFERDRHFSSWDGRANKLTELVKAAMNDPSSFKHIETRRRVLRRGEAPPAWLVVMDYSGTNAFNARVRGRVEALVDIMTGEVLEIIREN